MISYIHCNKAKIKGSLSISQRQVVIKLLEKKKQRKKIHTKLEAYFLT